MGKFIGWLGGILATVIGGWLLWYLTRAPATTTFEGMVINGEAHAPVVGAMVLVKIAKIKGESSNELYYDFTNEHGSYRLGFTGLGKSSTATIQVSANDFQPAEPKSIDRVTVDNRHDFDLTPLVPPTPKPASGLGATVEPPPVTAQVKYVPKLPAQAVNIQLSHTVQVAPFETNGNLNWSRVLSLVRHLQGQHVPYEWGKKSPADGFDSSGLVTYVLSSEGMNVDPHYCNSKCLKENLVHVEMPAVGDLVFCCENIVMFYIGGDTILGVDGSPQGIVDKSLSATVSGDAANQIRYLHVPYDSR